MFGRSRDREAGGDSLYIVRVAHPADGLGRDARKERAARMAQRDLAILADAAGSGDLPARHPGHQLMPIADAEDRNAQIKDCRIIMRRGRVIHAVRSAGKDDAPVARGANLVWSDFVIRPDLREHMLLPHAAGNEQVILPAEVQHKDCFLHNTLRFLHGIPIVFEAALPPQKHSEPSNARPRADQTRLVLRKPRAISTSLSIAKPCFAMDGSLHRHGFCQVLRLVDVAALLLCRVIGQQLQRHHGEAG